MARIDHFIKAIQKEADETDVVFEVSYKRTAKKDYDLMLKTGEVRVHYGMRYSTLMSLQKHKWWVVAREIVLNAVEDIAKEGEDE